MAENNTNKTNNLTAEQIAAIAAQAAAAAVSDRSVNANEAALRINNKIHEKQNRQQVYAAKIKSEMARGVNIKTVHIPRIYARWQPTFTIAINGCSISLKAGGTYRIHKDYAIILAKRLAHYDKKIAENRTDNISELYRNQLN